ncbi:recombinase family protein [Brevibacillus ruminantium]|uniref:Recombinase family protein n=1 Tax=Brevibacillus ruminantium TaxID=2950604 RepID=A0ABY4WJ65_9BACL|nr:recombinase family protein [Brevibacillus ruminantium]USG67176.1 recombinase family protein [Brevibacillus ruminantium]
MRTAIYIRVSTEEQAAEGFSIAAQKERLLAYTRSQDWSLAGIYTDEGISAKSISRPALQRLLTDVKSRKLDVVLVYRLDRLTRSVLDLYQLLQEFEKYDVRFKSCTEVYDTTTAIGRLFITLVAALAQWERENLGERVKLGMEQMARERKRPGGPPPYGYHLLHGELAPHPVEAKVVKLMFQHYVSGFTPGQIAESFNQKGYLGKHGGKWSGSTVTRLLRNPVYYGALRWNYAASGGKQKRADDWILAEDSHPAIIDQDTFDQVQARLKMRRKVHPRVLSSPFVFSGILYCARCQSEMRGKTASVRKSGKHYRHYYYLCKNRRLGLCRAPAIREDRLEAALLEQLAAFQPVLQSALDRKLQRLHASTAQEMDDHAQWKKRRQRWMEAYEAGIITLEELAAKQQQLNVMAERQTAKQHQLRIMAEQDAAKQQMDSISVSPFELGPMRDRSYPVTMEWSWLWEQASREERRQLAALLLERLEAETCPSIENCKNQTVALRIIAYR